ncbi:hypothetical protein BGZ94_006006 [Podila epigama]|nr:hypothetical protein BGZ94_006006 [Podila epigama]
MSLSTDENEHSIEMHLPYVFKVFEQYISNITIIPILVGALSVSKEQLYGQLLAPYLQDPENLFIISSDFCHWGSRFDYTYYVNTEGVVTQSLCKSSRHGGHGGGAVTTTAAASSATNTRADQKIHESIQQLDHEGMSKIEERSHQAFAEYLSKTRNTICGRHPIGVLLAAVEALDKDKHHIEFVHYSQSSRVVKVTDSSVSYASAFIQRL